jgi:hypothetical protein
MVAVAMETTKKTSFFVAIAVILKFLSLKIMCTHVRQNFWKVSSNSDHFRVFFVVSMATATILKIPKVVCTSTHGYLQEVRHAAPYCDHFGLLWRLF